MDISPHLLVKCICSLISSAVSTFAPTVTLGPSMLRMWINCVGEYNANYAGNCLAVNVRLGVAF